MADIKTRDTSKGTIKTINKAAVATERMKKAYVMTKDKAEHSTNASENSAEEYASDKIEVATDRAVHETAYRADKVGRWGVPASYLGVLTNAGILKADLFRNLQVAWMVQTGLSQMENGKTALMNQR